MEEGTGIQEVWRDGEKGGRHQGKRKMGRRALVLRCDCMPPRSPHAKAHSETRRPQISGPQVDRKGLQGRRHPGTRAPTSCANAGSRNVLISHSLL